MLKKRLDDRYEVGSDGNIYSDGLPLTPIGGVEVRLHGERRKVCYLVARAFVANREGRPYVRHINGDVKDNRATNLEWCEVEERKRRGRKPEIRYCAAWDSEGRKVGIYESPVEGALALGVEIRAVRRALNGKQKTAGGYFWRWGA